MVSPFVPGKDVPMVIAITITVTTTTIVRVDVLGGFEQPLELSATLPLIPSQMRPKYAGLSAIPKFDD